MLCDVTDITSYVEPETIDITQISEIIQQAETSVLLQARITNSDHPYLKQACIHLSVSLVLQKMKYTGELANQLKLGSETQQNDIEGQIQFHVNQAHEYVRKYLYTKMSSKVISGRAGPGTVNASSGR